MASVVPALPSVTVASVIPTVGDGSLSVIVPIPLVSAIVAFVGPARFRLKSSSTSSSASPTTGTATLLLVSPGANVSVPLVAW